MLGYNDARGKMLLKSIAHRYQSLLASDLPADSRSRRGVQPRFRLDEAPPFALGPAPTTRTQSPDSVSEIKMPYSLKGRNVLVTGGSRYAECSQPGFTARIQFDINR
jgi:hypothetical protein